MIHCRQGHPEEARKCWESAQQIIEKVRPKKAGDLAAAYATDWIEWNVLLPEAEAMLRERSSEVKVDTADKSTVEELADGPEA
jgi:hypothetical protein